MLEPALLPAVWFFLECRVSSQDLAAEYRAHHKLEDEKNDM